MIDLIWDIWGIVCLVAATLVPYVWLKMKESDDEQKRSEQYQRRKKRELQAYVGSLQRFGLPHQKRICGLCGHTGKLTDDLQCAKCGGDWNQLRCSVCGHEGEAKDNIQCAKCGTYWDGEVKELLDRG